MKPEAPAQAELEPRVRTSCTVCGERATRTIASARELEVQRRYLTRFHRRRLKARGPDALEERAAFTQDYATNVVACRGCGLVFRDPRPDDEAIASTYARDTYGPERLPALFESQLELFRPKARELARWLPGPRPVVIEIGSFVGGFLAACAEAGWDAVGIDPGREVAAFCETRGLRVLRENVDDCEFPPGTADLVAIWNTFDQLPDPHPTLRSLERSVKAGGVVVVRVPDGQCFEACMRLLARLPRPLRGPLLAAMAWNNLLSFPYLHGYSTATLDRLLAPYGFERVDVHGDVLTRLSDEQTLAWASWEERILKRAWLVLGRVLTRRRMARASRWPASAFPWIDVYYRASGPEKRDSAADVRGGSRWP